MQLVHKENLSLVFGEYLNGTVFMKRVDYLESTPRLTGSDAAGRGSPLSEIGRHRHKPGRLDSCHPGKRRT